MGYSIKMSSYQNKNFHQNNKTVSRLYYLYDGIPWTWVFTDIILKRAPVRHILYLQRIDVCTCHPWQVPVVRWKRVCGLPRPLEPLSTDSSPCGSWRQCCGGPMGWLEKWGTGTAPVHMADHRGLMGHCLQWQDGQHINTNEYHKWYN